MGGTLELQLVLCCHSDGCKEITRDYSGGNRAVVTSFHHGTYNYLDKNHSNDPEQVQRNQVHRSKSHVAGCDAGEEGLAWTANLYVCQPAPVPDTSGHQAASMSSPLGCSLIFISPPSAQLCTLFPGQRDLSAEVGGVSDTCQPPSVTSFTSFPSLQDF